MCVTFIMEPEEKKGNLAICNSLMGKSYCFPGLFSLWKIAFSLLVVSRGRQGVECSIQGTLTLTVYKLNCVTNYLERPYGTTAGED